MNAVNADAQAPDTEAAVTLRLLSVGFLYPDAAWRGRFAALLDEAERRRLFGSEELAGFRKAIASSSESDFFRLFGPAGDCSLDLGHHLGGNPYGQPRFLADLAGFYEAFGVRPGERPDDLPSLLELLGLLGLKEGLARRQGWEERREIAACATRRLAAAVIPGLRAFVAKVQTRDQAGFYGNLGRAALRLVESMAGGAAETGGNP